MATVGESFLAYEGGLGTATGRDGVATDIVVAETHFAIHTCGDEQLETGGALWHAGHALAAHILLNPELVAGRVVVDVGAGVGRVSVRDFVCVIVFSFRRRLQVVLPLVCAHISSSRLTFSLFTTDANRARS